MIEGLLADWIVLPAAWGRYKPALYDCSRPTWIGNEKLSSPDLPIDYVPVELPSGDTPVKDLTQTQNPDLTRKPDPTKRKTYTKVIGVENARSKPYAKATALNYKNH